MKNSVSENQGRTAGDRYELSPEGKNSAGRVRILFLDGCYDGTVGGSHSCLYTLIMNLDKGKYQPIASFYDEHVFSRRLRDAGIETHIFSWPAPWNAGQESGNGGVTRGLRLPMKLLQKIVNFWFVFLRPALGHMAFIRRNRIDVVHLNNSLNTNHDWMLGTWLAGVKLVSHERGVSARLSLTARIMARIVDRFVCVSGMIYDHLLKEGIPPGRMSVVYDGIDPESFRRGRPAELVRQELGITPGWPVIGVLGNVKEWKGQEIIVRAARILRDRWPDLVCLIIGSAGEDDPYVIRLRRLIEDLGLQGSVRLTGFQECPSEFLAVMDVVCHTSITPEPFGMVNLEAMYMSKPVVSTNIGGPVEVFTDGVNGFLIQPGNPDILANAVASLLADPERANRIGLAARSHVMERFAARSTAAAMQRMYDSLLRVK